MMKTVIRVALACILLVGVAFADKHGKGKGSGDSEGSKGGSFKSGVIGSIPGLTIGGVPSGGAKWVVREGKATLSPSGELELEVKGLLISGGPADGTTGPVTQIAASLVCGGSGGMVVATTPAVNLSAAGDAELEAKITPPLPCFGTIILVRVAGTNGTLLPTPLAPTVPFIAVTGFNSLAGGHDDDDGDK